MSKKTWLILVLALAFLCTFAVLCGTVGYWALQKGRSAEGPGLSKGVEFPLVPPASGEPVSLGTLRLAGDLPPTLDPAMVQDSTSAEYIVHLFSGLVTLDADLEIVPDLAERWEVDGTGRLYTFYLDPQATFHNGRPILAEDVIYSIERACDPALGSPVAPSYLDDIVGVAEYVQGRVEHIAGLKAPAAHTVQIEIDAPKAFFLAKLTYPTSFVVDREQIEREGESWMRQPNGSGPFRLESISRERIVLVRNAAYHKGAPALRRVEFIIDGGLPITMYENGELDLVGVAPSEIERVLDPYNPLHNEHRVAPELSVQYIGLNVDKPPFDDPLVRQALARAIDREKLADLVLKGTARPALGILPPGMPGFNEALVGLSYDPEQARALLARSRYGAPGAMPEIRLAVSGTSGHMPPMTGAVVAMLKENLGLEVLVEQVEWADFLRDMNEHRYQAFSAGWVADYPDPQNFLDILFHSRSAQNHTGYANAEVDRLLELARVEEDVDARLEYYRQAEQKIVLDAPWIPLTHGLNHILVKPYVQGYRASAGLYPWLADISLKSEK
ncbi:MAG: peptide ABC transporter substrate-binding protein [Chloroflexi bacterium]|nr:peptide ABC transporter substrate-binding protein [Chloroflexota bacterium]